MASRNVYSLKEFMEIISIQEQTCFQKSRYEQSRRDEQRVDEHPLVTEMFGELYFRESPTSSLDALFSAPATGFRGAAPEPAAAEEKPSEEVKAAADDDSDDHGNGNGKDHTPDTPEQVPGFGV